MKVHLCCGDVYLSGHINVDIGGRKLRKGEANPNLTTLDRYFTRPFSTEFSKRTRGECIVDKKMNLTENWMDFSNNSVDEIVMISAIEHFTKRDAAHIVGEARRVLVSGGRFIFDFPDIHEDVRKHYKTDPEWLMELIYCNQKNEYSTHKWGYTRKTIKELLGDSWKVQFKTVVKHDYPMIGVVARKL